MTRRAFVRTTGVGAAGLLALPAAAGLRREQALSFNAGILLASEGSYARSGDSFVDGFRMALAASGASATLTTRLAPRGVDGAYGAVGELAASGVDVIVAGVTSPVAHLVAPLLADRQLPL